MNTERLSSLSAFVPAHNEEENIVPVARTLLRVLPTIADRWEVVVVNDGSTDRTRALIDGLAANEPGLRVVHHERNLGYGAAVRSGIHAARHEFVFFTDGDQQFDPAQIALLVSKLPGADVVAGYRCTRADRPFRRLCTWLWNVLVRVAFGVPVRDVNCAFKLFRREAVRSLDLQADGAMVSAEILTRARQNGSKIVEVPVDHFPRRHGAASGGRPAVIARALAEFWQLVGPLRRGETALPARRVAPAVRTSQHPETP